MSVVRRFLPYWVAALGSLLLSGWYFHLEEVVNKDGVLYLLAAQGDEASATTLGRWIFYSRLIQAMAWITGLEAESAALAVNALLDLLLVLAFVRLVEELGAGRRALLVAAVAVLVLPYLNDNRAQVIRDHGYWAFTLVALVCYLRLFRRFSWGWLLGWYGAMGLATLFRVEGAAFVALMPLGLLLRPVPWRRRILETGLAYLPLGLGVALVAGVRPDLLQGNRLGATLANGATLLRQAFGPGPSERAEGLRQLLSPYYSHGTALLVIWFAALVDILKDLAKALSWPFFLVLLLRRWFPAPGLPAEYRRVLLAYGGVSAFVLLFQELRSFTMVSRYAVALALALLPVVVFALEELWRRYEAGRAGRLLPGLALFAVVALAADSIIESPGHRGYLVETGDWVAANLPADARILTDHERRRMEYYGNGRRPGSRTVVLYAGGGTTPLSAYGFALVGDPESDLGRAVRRVHAVPLHTVPRGRGRKMVVYRLPARQEAP